MMPTPTLTVSEASARVWTLPDGTLHREDGPAVEWVDGTKFWYRLGHVHREGGPAVEKADGGRMWLQNGQRHREDGPAIENADGSTQYFIHGQPLSYEDWAWRTGRTPKVSRFDRLVESELEGDEL